MIKTLKNHFIKITRPLFFQKYIQYVQSHILSFMKLFILNFSFNFPFSCPLIYRISSQITFLLSTFFFAVILSTIIPVNFCLLSFLLSSYLQNFLSDYLSPVYFLFCCHPVYKHCCHLNVLSTFLSPVLLSTEFPLRLPFFCPLSFLLPSCL